MNGNVPAMQFRNCRDAFYRTQMESPELALLDLEIVKHWKRSSTLSSWTGVRLTVRAA
jgi:hypothetical protein